MLERGRLTNGTTWHAAGLVSQVRGTHALTALPRMNAATYERLSAETGIETGLRRCGALTVARTEARLTESLYSVSMARDFDIPVEVFDGPDIKSLWPNARVDDLVGGVLFPTDGTVNPGDATLAFAKGAKDARRAVRAGSDGQRTSASTADGAPGWGPTAGRSRRRPWCSRLACGRRSWRGVAGVSVALYPAEHVWVMTEPAEGADETCAVPARPRRLSLHPPLPGPLPGGRVRAEGQAQAARRRPDRRLRGVRTRLGSLRARARERSAAAPRAADGRVQSFPARARELHAGRELPSRRVPRGAGVVRRGRV